MTIGRLQIPASLAGGCMCRTVRYRISAAPIAAGLCHCDRCRPQSGSAFSTVIIIRRSTIEIEGETAVFDDIGSSGSMLRADIARAAGRHSRQNLM